ncbi:MAG: RNA polymerase sigma factor [Deltaproteobacteria bacterium]|nr:RNA polymerase sigma factor [Deltaproteobacteria bacterium]
MPGEADLDAALLGRTAEGDRRAFGELVARHQAAVYRFSLRMMGDEASAEDVLQETFISALKKAATFRGTGSARAWLMAIARNTGRMSRRRHAGEPSQFESLDALGREAGWGAEADLAELLDERNRREQLERALAELPPLDREVLLVRDVEGLSGEETAEALGLSIAATKSRLHRARLRLAAALGKGGPHGRGS